MKSAPKHYTEQMEEKIAAAMTVEDKVRVNQIEKMKAAQKERRIHLTNFLDTEHESVLL